MGEKMNGRTTVYSKAWAGVLAAAAAAVAVPVTQGATLRFDNTGGDGLWETGQNWLDGDNATRHVPTTADIAEISNNFTASISSAQTVSELQVAHPDSSATTVPGTATLNVLSGTNLQVTSTNGARIGRKILVGSGQLPGSSTGRVLQSGGTLQVNAGTNGLRLSQADSGVVADSLYRMTGGSARGGPTNGTMTAPLQIGNVANQFNRAEFHMSGSGVTEARFEDVRIAGGASAGSVAVLHFSLDAGGVTPLIAEDEMRFAGLGSNLLEIDLIGEAPEANITLIMADRLNTASSAPAEAFTGMPEGTPIVRQFGGFEYTWTLDYNDASDNGVLDAFVRLNFVSKTVIPEPSSLALLGAGALMLARRRRS